MTVQQETDTHGVELTEAAAVQGEGTARSGGPRRPALRIAVQPGGCAGLRYQLFFDDRSLDGDLIGDFDGVEARCRPDERPVRRGCGDRLRRHHREAGLHDRQPERHGLVRLRRLVQLSRVPTSTAVGAVTHRGPSRVSLRSPCTGAACLARVPASSADLRAAERLQPRDHRRYRFHRHRPPHALPGQFAEQLLADQLDHISLSFLVDDLVDPARRCRRQHRVRDGRARRFAAARRRGRRRLRRVPRLAGGQRRRLHVPSRSPTTAHTARFVCTTDDDMAQIASFYPGAMGEAREISIAPSLHDRASTSC